MSYEKLYDTQGRVKGYKVRWRDSSGRSRRRTVRREKDAILLDAEMKRKKAMGELISHERGTMHLEAFYEIWWHQYALVHLSPRTRDCYERLWRLHIAPTFAGTKLRGLASEDVAALAGDLSKRLGPASVRKILALLQTVLHRAVEWQYIATNPVVGVKRPRLIEHRGRALSAEQLEALCKELDHRSSAIVRLLAYTGLRPGELRALHWEDLTPHFIRVDRAVSSNQLGPTKNYKKRSIEIRDDARKVLLEWYVACGRPATNSYIFPSVDGTGLWTDNAYACWSNRTFGDAALRAGLRGIRVYDLRHTFISTLLVEGRDVYWIARQAGHTPEVMLTTYAHILGEDKSVPFERPDNLDVLSILRAL